MSRTPQLVPLSVHSRYSLMWGNSDIRTLCRSAAQMGYRRLALTDTDNLYGLWSFLAACRDEGIDPIIGAELTDPVSKRRAVCLVENADGYSSLCRLLTCRHLERDFDLETAVIDHSRGLTVLTNDPGLLKIWHAAGIFVAASMLRRPLFGGHPLRRMADYLQVPLVAAPGAFFLNPEDRVLHRLLRAIERNVSLSHLQEKDTAPADAWLARPEVYAERFSICPEAIRWSRQIAERLTFKGPDFGIVMPPWRGESGETAAACLRESVYAGALNRYGCELAEPVVERIENELRVIADMGFSAYFLVVHDIVKKSPRTCGRGSGAASIIAYCLGITNVCPLKHNLYFERFLNPSRTDPPDLDIDFAWDERDSVIQAVLHRYQGHAAMVSSHVLFQPRMALREVAKVFGLTEEEISAITKRMPFYLHMADTSDTGCWPELQALPELKHMDYPEPWPRILRLAWKLVGHPRYISVHPGGVVITPRPIDTYVPVERAAKGVPVIQWDKDGAESAGLIKIDLLGNRSLGVIRDALHNIRNNNVNFEESCWEPEDDFATQEALSQGHTMGCFYIESPAMRLLQKKSGVGDFEHLVIHSSIIRPAANEFIREYLRRLHGGRWDPIHPLLADVLDETFGIMVYQEDVARAAVSIAGFSHGDADALRKILSKKDRDRKLRDYYQRFYSGARARGVSEKKIVEIWKMIMSFSGYSFCKPHSASYAKVSFQAAYLKIHFPAEFMAAVISNQGGFYSTFAYVSECRRMGIDILPPDINQSDSAWTGNEGTIRVGLMAISGLSERCRAAIIAQRQAAPFQSTADVLQRIRPDDAEARALIRCGALDAFCGAGQRAALLWELALWQKNRETASKTRSLFGCAPDRPPPPAIPGYDEQERLRHEFAVLGFLCDRHPMTLFSPALQRFRSIKAASLAHFIGKRVKFAGWLITGKRVQTKRGETMEFLTFEDATGSVEATFFPETYRRFCHLVARNRPYLLEGRVESDWGAVTLTVDKIWSL